MIEFVWTWRVRGNRIYHQSGLIVRLDPLPHGTRGRHVAVQRGAKRYIAIMEQAPNDMAPPSARHLLRLAALEWASGPRY